MLDPDTVFRLANGASLLGWVALLPAAGALGLDERSLRGVNVWFKPMKFMASVGLFALTTAWFFDLLPAPRRLRWPARTVFTVPYAA